MINAAPEHVPLAALTARSFFSRAHPGQVPWRWTFARAIVRPLAVCTLPVMIGALVTVLQGFPALAFLTVGFPLAAVAAAVWTVYRMHATVAEIHLLPGAAAVRSVWECLRTDRPLAWSPILDLRVTTTTFTLALGDASYELERDAWDDADAFLETLVQARHREPFPPYRTPGPGP